MPSPNSYRQEFLQQVCSYVRSKTMHREIARELEDHIEDHMDSLMESGLSLEEAENKAIEAMGDPEEIGRELNKLYRPFVEGILTLTRVLTVIGVLYCIWVFLYVGFVGLLSFGPLNYSIDKEDIAYTQKLVGKQKVGAITYKLQKMTRLDDGTILITYITYGDNIDIILRGWTSPNLGAYDEKGEHYDTKGSSGAGLWHRNQIIVEDFDPKRGETIILKTFSYYGDVIFSVPVREVE